MKCKGNDVQFYLREHRIWIDILKKKSYSSLDLCLACFVSRWSHICSSGILHLICRGSTFFMIVSVLKYVMLYYWTFMMVDKYNQTFISGYKSGLLFCFVLSLRGTCLLLNTNTWQKKQGTVHMRCIKEKLTNLLIAEGRKEYLYVLVLAVGWLRRESEGSLWDRTNCTLFSSCFYGVPMILL